MPFLRLFAKKEKQQSNPQSRRPGRIPSGSDRSSHEEDGYVLPSIRTSHGHFLAPNPPGSSTSRTSSYSDASSLRDPPMTLRLVTSPTSLSGYSDRYPFPHPPLQSRAGTTTTTTTTVSQSSLPPRRSSLFSQLSLGPESAVSLLSTTSLAPSATRSHADSKTSEMSSPVSPHSPSSKSTASAKRRPSFFGWASSREVGKSSDTRSVKSSQSAADDHSFNLKSFRHVRASAELVAPPVPSLPPSRLTPSPIPMPTPTPVSTAPRTTPGFQVTSRPRGNSTEALNVLAPPELTKTQSSQTVTAGAFRQAARRSLTNLQTTVPGVAALATSSRTSLEALNRPVDSHPPSPSPSSSRQSQDIRIPAKESHRIPPRPPRERSVMASIPSNVVSSGRLQPHSSKVAMQTNNEQRPGITTYPLTTSSSDESDESDSAESASLQRKVTLTQSTVSPISRPTSFLPPVSSTSKSATQVSPIVQGSSPRTSKTPATRNTTPTSSSTGTIYRRQQASLSASAIPLQRQSTGALTALSYRTQKLKGGAFSSTSESDTSESSSNSGSSDDAPLSVINYGKTPRTQTRSSRASPKKPLVDLNAKSTFVTTDKPVPRRTNDIKRNLSARSTRSAEDLRADEGHSLRSVNLPHEGQRARPLVSLKETSQPVSSRTSTALLQPPPLTSKKDLLPRPAAKFSSRGFRESPASSSNGADSSSGFLPLTPREGSDIGSEVARGHAKRRSVTFVSSHGETSSDAKAEEHRRRERRRSEARNAIELGNVVNGKGPLHDPRDEDPTLDFGTGSLLPQQPLGPDVWNLMGASTLTNPWQIAPKQPYILPTTTSMTDMGYFAAHQRAMMIAKQTYQMAVAQQAMAAAGEEWERSSAMGVMSGDGSMLGWNGGVNVLPSSARSMYAGSVIGGSSVHGGGWGSRSVYGDSFGPAMAHSSMHFQHPVPFPHTSQAGSSPMDTHQDPSGRQRQRTKTAPSHAPPNIQQSWGRNTPPSSWKIK